MKISAKLFLGFSIMIIISFLIGVVGTAGMRRLRDSGVQIYESRVLALQYADRAHMAFARMNVHKRQVVISGCNNDLPSALSAQQQFEDSTRDFLYWMEIGIEAAASEETVVFHNEIMELFENSYEQTAGEIIRISIDDMPAHTGKPEVNRMLGDIYEVNAEIESLFEDLVQYNTDMVEMMVGESDRVTSSHIALQVFLVALAVAVACIIAYYITTGITAPIRESARVLENIARGDFTARVSGDYKGEMGLVKDSINDAAARLKWFVSQFTSAQMEVYKTDAEKDRIEAGAQSMLAGINYAAGIQRSLLPAKLDFDNAFFDHSVIWKPRDIVSGDIYWMRTFSKGTTLCVCDCTGHGTSGALLTMLIVSAFEAVVRMHNCHDTADIIWRLEDRLTSVFSSNRGLRREGGGGIRDGCDLAVLFVDNEGGVNISSGNTHVFICDGVEVSQIRGQRIYVGEGRIKSKDEITITQIPPNPWNKYYIGSDGLFSQIGGGQNEPYGYSAFRQIILDSHFENQASITERIWTAFEAYRGDEQQVDDIELVTFKPKTTGAASRTSAELHNTKGGEKDGSV